ncbi:MAG: methylmalonyl Co-A mutase-associated GTPase MeaB [Candidatus Brocadiae bacterium]|nr:methylmalonyl Co-A mutase-associated GTPase MeaB [Candidatus Brocadiia bacterium]
MISYSIEDIVQGILKKNRRILAKAVSLVESTLPEDIAKSQELIDRLLNYSGKSLRIGISGVPGVGKSTFIDAFGLMLLEKNRKLAVLAVDPSSSRSGGSILGDKTRMLSLSQRPDVFIRPSPSSGALGGVARKTRETILLCEAAGFDTILVETVGVGQSETTVASMVDFLLVLMLPNAGDELQGIKRGIMEMGDGFVVNKADGEQIAAANLTARRLENALHFLTPRTKGWNPFVTLCSSLEKKGMEEIEKHIQKFFLDSCRIQERRKAQDSQWMHSLIQESLYNQFYSHPKIFQLLLEKEKEIWDNKKTATKAALELLKVFENTLTAAK